MPSRPLCRILDEPKVITSFLSRVFTNRVGFKVVVVLFGPGSAFLCSTTDFFPQETKYSRVKLQFQQKKNYGYGEFIRRVVVSCGSCACVPRDEERGKISRFVQDSLPLPASYRACRSSRFISWWLDSVVVLDGMSGYMPCARTATMDCYWVFFLKKN